MGYPFAYFYSACCDYSTANAGRCMDGLPIWLWTALIHKKTPSVIRSLICGKGLHPIHKHPFQFQNGIME